MPSRPGNPGGPQAHGPANTNASDTTNAKDKQPPGDRSPGGCSRHEPGYTAGARFHLFFCRRCRSCRARPRTTPTPQRRHVSPSRALPVDASRSACRRSLFTSPGTTSPPPPGFLPVFQIPATNQQGIPRQHRHTRRRQHAGPNRVVNRTDGTPRNLRRFRDRHEG
jgi:hypothetical protein